MRKALAVLAVSLLGLAEAHSGELHGYEALYGTCLNYSGSDLKDEGYAGTAYILVGDGKNHALSAGYSYTKIKYKNAPDLNQQDFTISYSNTNQLLKNHTFTFGLHYIDSDDELTDRGLSFFFDGTYSSYQKAYPYLFNWSSGIGVYYTRYPNTIDFYTFQVTPHGTFRLFSSPRKGALYLDLIGYGIHVSDREEVGIGKSNYYSIEGALRYYYGPYDLKVGGWLGEQVFAVKSSGFVVYNLSEKYKGGATLEAGYTFKSGLRFSLNYTYNRYKELSSDNDVNQSVVTVSLGYKF